MNRERWIGWLFFLDSGFLLDGINAKYDFGKQDFNQKVFFLEGAKIHMYNKKIKCHW